MINRFGRRREGMSPSGIQRDGPQMSEHSHRPPFRRTSRLRQKQWNTPQRSRSITVNARARDRVPFLVGSFRQVERQDGRQVDGEHHCGVCCRSVGLRPESRSLSSRRAEPRQSGPALRRAWLQTARRREFQLGMLRRTWPREIIRVRCRCRIELLRGRSVRGWRHLFVASRSLWTSYPSQLCITVTTTRGQRPAGWRLLPVTWRSHSNGSSS